MVINDAFPFSYGYRWCVSEFAECATGTVSNLSETTKTFTRASLSPCSAYTACFSVSSSAEQYATAPHAYIVFHIECEE